MKKTEIVFQVWDKKFSIFPNRHDYRCYKGSSEENQNFYGGASILFCVPSTIFDDEFDLGAKFNIKRFPLSNFWSTLHRDKVQNMSVTVESVTDILNSIGREFKMRKQYERFLSDCYKQQVISR